MPNPNTSAVEDSLVTWAGDLATVTWYPATAADDPSESPAQVATFRVAYLGRDGVGYSDLLFSVELEDGVVPPAALRELTDAVVRATSTPSCVFGNL